MFTLSSELDAYLSELSNAIELEITELHPRICKGNVAAIVDTELRRTALPFIVSASKGNIQSVPHLFTNARWRADRLKTRLSELITQGISIVSDQFCDNDSSIRLSPLSADTHNGGLRILRLTSALADLVVKKQDVGTYEVYRILCNFLSQRLSLNISPPNAYVSEDATCYAVCYAPSQTKKNSNPKHFMRNLGTITAALYALNALDIHYENLVVFGENPWVFDTECLLANYYDAQVATRSRLFFTGMVSLDPNLSGMRGGEAPMVKVGAHIGADGLVNLFEPRVSVENMLLTETGLPISPKTFSADVVQGFRVGYQMIAQSKDDVIAEVEKSFPNGIVTRVLIRDTLQYAMTIEALSIPTVRRMEWENFVIHKFSNSIMKFEEFRNEILPYEISDLLKGDIPLFHMTSATGDVTHNKDTVFSLGLSATFTNRLRRSLGSLSDTDCSAAVQELTTFLT